MELRKYYPFLDGLRCFAILWVIAHHINLEFIFTPSAGQIERSWAFKLAWAGHYGVDIFFVISGFLITGLVLSNSHPKIDVKRFYIRRCFKILPSYYFLLWFVFLFHLYILKENPSLLNGFTQTLPNFIFFIQNIVPSRSPTLGHLWSIAVEEHFYLTYPIFIYLIYLGKNQIVAKRGLLLSLIAVIMICTMMRYVFLPHSPTQNTFFRVDALALGCVIRILEEKIYQIPNPKQLTAFLCLLLSIALWIFLVSHGLNDAWYYYTCACVASGLLIVSCLLGLDILTRFLELDIFRWVGKISYNLYLWHYPLIFISYYMFKAIPQMIVPFYMVATFFMGWIMTKTIEKYFLDLRNRHYP